MWAPRRRGRRPRLRRGPCPPVAAPPPGCSGLNRHLAKVSSGISAVTVAAAAPPPPPGGAALAITAVSSPYLEVLRLFPPLPVTLALAVAGVAALLATLNIAVGRSLRVSLGTALVSSPLCAAATAAPLVPWLAAHPEQTALLAQSVGLMRSEGAAAAAGPADLSAVATESDGRLGNSRAPSTGRRWWPTRCSVSRSTSSA